MTHWLNDKQAHHPHSVGWMLNLHHYNFHPVYGIDEAWGKLNYDTLKVGKGWNDYLA